MNEFERQLPTFRWAATNRGDDLQAVAARELGDANRWSELVWLNRLDYPYLTDEELLAGDGVLLTGALIKIPSPQQPQPADNNDQVFERDCVLIDKLLADDGEGDFAVISGTKNLKQQLEHRLNTPKGQARRHPDYGCLVWRLKGAVTGPVANMLGAQYVKTCLQADYRVSSVTSSTAETVGDGTQITATAMTIAGGKVDLLAGA